MKTCTCCKENKEDSAFSKRKNKAQTGYLLRSHCNKCRNATKLNWKANTKYTPEIILDKIKNGNLHGFSQSPIILNVVNELSFFLNENVTFRQRIFHLKNDLIDIPKCNMCDNFAQFMDYSDTYSDHCSIECQKIHNQEKRKKYKNGYYQENKGHLIKRSRNTQLTNHDEYLKNQRDYYNKNKKECIKNNILWAQNNRDLVRKSHKAYRMRHPHICAWRRVLGNFLTRVQQQKTDRTYDMLGYSAEELKSHITDLLEDGMTWENYGKWHIDHIKPLTKFDPGTPANVVNALSNLQPLWASDNISKGNKYKDIT